MTAKLLAAWDNRDALEALYTAHLRGDTCDADTWAAVNTPDSAYADPDLNPHLPPHWLALKDMWYRRTAELSLMYSMSRAVVRLHSGHATVREVLGLD